MRELNYVCCDCVCCDGVRRLDVHVNMSHSFFPFAVHCSVSFGIAVSNTPLLLTSTPASPAPICMVFVVLVNWCMCALGGARRGDAGVCSHSVLVLFVIRTKRCKVRFYWSFFSSLLYSILHPPICIAKAVHYCVHVQWYVGTEGGDGLKRWG